MTAVAVPPPGRTAADSWASVPPPKYMLRGTPWDAALERIRWLYDEFDHVSVSNSGGKDSTVVVELALIVAREKNRLPLNVVWLDQECEYEATVEYQRWMRTRPEVDFCWYQIPFRLFNATNHQDHWLRVWGEGEEWVRPKEQGTIHENTLVNRDGTRADRFKDVLKAINRNTGGAILTGMRVEESPGRRLLLTSTPAYKWATWSSGAMEGGPHVMFHPIYDWTFTDIWKAIHDNGWRYNRHYDHMYWYGVPPKGMRVSNYHHETALKSLHWLQEIEPATYEAATRRLEGISTYSHLKDDQYIKDLPYMFGSWAEYRDHLLANLVTDPFGREMFVKQIRKLSVSLPEADPEELARLMVRVIIRNDIYGAYVGDYLVVNRKDGGKSWK